MQSHPDGLALAVADNPQSAGSVSASQDLEVSQCTIQLRLLVAAGVAMTLFSATLAFDWWDGLGDFDAVLGYAGVFVFALMTCRLIWMLPADRGPVVVVTPYGIRDLRIGNEFLLWDSIAQVSAEEQRGHKTIVLTPTPALQRQLCKIHLLARCAQADRIVIRSEGLATDFDTLLHACRDCHAARTALQQEDEQHTHGIALRAS